MWVLGMELRSLERAVSSLNCLALNSSPWYSNLWVEGYLRQRSGVMLLLHTLCTLEQVNYLKC